MIKKRSGSALLITLLLLSAASSIIIVSNKLFQVNARQAVSTQQALLAEQMANQAIQEGLFRYYKIQAGASAGLNANGEYGETGANYSLQPLRRISLGVNCETFDLDRSVSTAVPGDTCPYYDLAIRQYFGFAGGAPAVGLGYTKRELALGKTVVLKILKQTSQARFTPFFSSPLGRVAISGCSTPSNCSVSLGNFANGQTATVNSGLYVALQFKVTGADLQPDSVTKNPGLKLAGDGDFTIQKGYITIDAIGYSGNVQRKLILTMRGTDPLDKTKGTRDLLPFAQTFDSLGVPK